jgi:hypothetical protein
MKLTSVATILDFDPYNTHQYGPTHNFGEVVKLADGRWFRYAKDSGSGNTKGHVEVSPAIIADGQNMTVTTAPAIGGVTVIATHGSTAASAGIYDEGYAIVNAGTGLGQQFQIQHSSAVTSAGSYALTLTLAEGAQVALSTSDSKLSVVHNTYNGTREATGSTLRPAGVALVSTTASYYYWAQTRGVCGVIASSTGVTTGYALANSASTTAATVENAGTAGQVVTVGYALYTGATGEYRPVMLTIN